MRRAGGLPLDDGPEGPFVDHDRHHYPGSVEGGTEMVPAVRMSHHKVR
ncbi:MAG: hypothetical protein WBO49_03935 [Candidatus Saccharimonas sp.]